MGIIKDFIELLFIIAAFQVLKKSRDEIVGDIESVSTGVFIFKWLLHLFFLCLYYSFAPLFSITIVIFIILQIITGLWILINKEGYFSTFEKIPEVIDKIFPLAYLLYFGYNFLSFLF